MPGPNSAPESLLDSEGVPINPSIKELQEAEAGLMLAGYKDIEITATNAAGNPTTIVFRTTVSGATAFTMTITYDTNGNFQRATVA